MSIEPVAAAVAVELRLVRAGERLEVDWRDGVRSVLAATVLRSGCRCAQCESTRRRGGSVVVPASIAIRGLEPFGANAVRLHFSDGHARGIFPFTYLRGLASAAAS